jgi:hypothetical protein
VHDLPVLDLRDAAVRDSLAITESDLVGARDRPQQLGRRARRMGAMGIVGPSAAHAGHWSLVVFPAGFASVSAVGSRAQHPEPPLSA